LAGGILSLRKFLKPADQTPKSGTRHHVPGLICTPEASCHVPGLRLLHPVTGRQDPAEHRTKLRGPPWHHSIVLLSPHGCTNLPCQKRAPAWERSCYQERCKGPLKSFFGN